MSGIQWCPIARKWCTCEKRCEDYDGVNAYAERMLRRDQLERLEGAPEDNISDIKSNPLTRK